MSSSQQSLLLGKELPLQLPQDVVLMRMGNLPNPSGWENYTSEGSSLDGLPIRGKVSGAASVVAGSPQSFNLGRPRLTSSTGGHAGSIQSQNNTPPIVSPRVTTGTSGSHNHLVNTNTPPTVDSTFPVNADSLSHRGIKYTLIRTPSGSTSVPPNCIVFNAANAIFPNFTSYLAGSLPVSLGGPFPAEPSAGAYGLFLGNGPGGSQSYQPAPGTQFRDGILPRMNPFSPAGSHSHAPPTQGNGGPSPPAAINPAARVTLPVPVVQQSTVHDHQISDVSATFFYFWPFFHLKPQYCTTPQNAVSGMIVMFRGATVPPGWFVCNGANGTPNLDNQYIGFRDAVQPSTGPALQGRPQGFIGPLNSIFIGTLVPPSPGLMERSVDSFSMASFSWPHGHSFTSAPPTALPNRGATVNNHSHQVEPHSHSHGIPIPPGIPTGFIPRHFSIMFIMKA